MGSKLWSKEDSERLKTLWENDVASSEIASRFKSKYTRAAIMGKLDRMGLLNKKEIIKLSTKIPRWVRELALGEVQHDPSQGCETCHPTQDQEIQQSAPRVRTLNLFHS